MINKITNPVVGGVRFNKKQHLSVAWVFQYYQDGCTHDQLALYKACQHIKNYRNSAG